MKRTLFSAHRSGARTFRPVFGRILPPLLFSLLVLGCWQSYVRLARIDELLLPAPSSVAAALWTDRALLLDSTWTTLGEIALGYLAALVLGIALGVVLHAASWLERAIYPWLVASQSIPTVAVAPLLVLWTGFDLRPKVLVVTLVCFFPLVVNTMDGLRAAERELLDLLRTLGASRWRIFRLAQLPAALPSVFSGMRIAAALSVVGAVFGEWTGASSGLGYLILTLNNQSRTADVFAVIAILAAIGIALFALVSILERLLLPWYYLEGKRR